MKKLLLLIFLLPVLGNAELLDCGVASIDKVYVQSNRSDNGIHQNSALIILGDDKSLECENVTFAQIKNTEASCDGILSMAIATYVS